MQGNLDPTLVFAPTEVMTARAAEIIEVLNEILTAERLPFDFMLNALRLNEGVPITMFEARTGLVRNAIAGQLAKAHANGWLERDPDWIRPTELGRRFTNDVIGLFLP